MIIVLFISSQVQQNAIDMHEFEAKMLPVLLSLAKDRVPNVRIVVAKCISHAILRNGKLDVDDNTVTDR